MTQTPSPLWTESQFEQQRNASIDLFRERRMLEDLGSYNAAYVDAHSAVAQLFHLTKNLDVVALRAAAVQVVTNRPLFDALRYVAGPPISEDDLKTLTDVNSFNPARVTREPHRATEAVETVILGLDGHRFNWVGEGRQPSDAERDAAIIATAALLAQRRTITRRANESKNEQEEAVASTLVAAGVHQVSPRDIPTFNQAPAPGQFCHESSVGGRKADLVVRLWDGRLMPIECKVSNSSTNSVKRLNNDAAVKAKTWLEKFGTSQTVPCAVLGGVFRCHNLLDAQAGGLTIFWAHDLESLKTFVTSTR